MALSISTPNAQFFSWPSIGNVENTTGRFHPFTRTRTSTFDTTGIPFEAILAEQTAIHELRLLQFDFDAQVPTINIEFVTNGVTYYNILWSNGDPPLTIDFSTTPSNTLGSPAGDAPLIMEEGETLELKITDGDRLNNQDRINLYATLWGVRFPT